MKKKTEIIRMKAVAGEGTNAGISRFRPTFCRISFPGKNKFEYLCPYGLNFGNRENRRNSAGCKTGREKIALFCKMDDIGFNYENVSRTRPLFYADAESV